MALTEETVQDKIEIVGEFKHIQVRTATVIKKDGVEIARSAISRELMKMGGKPIFRNGFKSDNGNQIIDIHNMPMDVPFELEALINNIPGVVENGIFSKRKADTIICASASSIEII